MPNTNDDLQIPGAWVTDAHDETLGKLHSNDGLKNSRASEGPKKEVFIAVMGMTGSGKSSFVKVLTKNEDIEIGNTLQSCTQAVSSFSFCFGSLQINLIDTPGFDDTTRSNTEVLKHVSGWLAETYRFGIKLTGIIYLHKITDNRMAGSAMLNLAMFKHLCGVKCLPNVIFATTMWDIAGEGEEYLAREKELTSNSAYWETLIKKGAKCCRHNGSSDSALKILSMLEGCEETVLDIQQQIVDQKQDLADTPAGRSLEEELRKIEEEFKEELKIQKALMDEAIREKDDEMKEKEKEIRDKDGELKEKEKEIRENNEKSKAESEELAAKWAREIEKKEEKIKNAENERAALKGSLESIENERAALRDYLESIRNEKAALRGNLESVESEKVALQDKVKSTKRAGCRNVAAIILVSTILIGLLLAGIAALNRAYEQLGEIALERIGQLQEEANDMARQYNSDLARASAKHWVDTAASVAASASTILMNGVLVWQGAGLISQAGGALYKFWSQGKDNSGPVRPRIENLPAYRAPVQVHNYQVVQN